jgi:hypothetical protein
MTPLFGSLQREHDAAKAERAVHRLEDHAQHFVQAERLLRQRVGHVLDARREHIGRRQRGRHGLDARHHQRGGFGRRSTGVRRRNRWRRARLLDQATRRRIGLEAQPHGIGQLAQLAARRLDGLRHLARRHTECGGITCRQRLGRRARGVVGAHHGLGHLVARARQPAQPFVAGVDAPPRWVTLGRAHALLQRVR